MTPGLLLVRVGLAGPMIYHGSQKLFGWFGGYGIEGTAGWMASQGIPFPVLSTTLAGSAEFFGGLGAAGGPLHQAGGGRTGVHDARRRLDPPGRRVQRREGRAWNTADAGAGFRRRRPRGGRPLDAPALAAACAGLAGRGTARRRDTGTAAVAS